jgi:hypothetical protein
MSSSLVHYFLLASFLCETAANTCFQDPSQAKCTDISSTYTTTDINNDLDSLCMMMSGMSGCIVREACKTTPNGATGQPCQPWTILADICSTKGGAAMTGMKGCNRYNELCNNDTTVVTKCTTKATPSLVLEKDAKKNTIDMCTGGMSDMKGCSDCNKVSCPQPLQSLSMVCMAMPGMAKCSSWKSMCQDVTTSEGGGEILLPMFCNSEFNTTSDKCNAGGMKMYFHGGVHDMVLFKSWYACNLGQYVIVLILTYLVSFGSSVFRLQRKKMETFIYLKCCCRSGINSNSGGDVGGGNYNIHSALLTDNAYSVNIGVSGMTCAACTKTVRTSIEKGFASSDADIVLTEPPTVTVRLENGGSVELVLKCNQSIIARAIDAAVSQIEIVGFDVRDTSTPTPLVQQQVSPASSSSLTINKVNPYPKNAVKAFLTGLQLTVDYALMLAAMTFNAGVFFAIVLGYSTSKEKNVAIFVTC